MSEFEKHNSVFHAFEEAARLYSARPFLRAPASSTESYADCAIEYSYGDAQQRVRDLAQRYAGCGLSAGDRVALAFDSRVDVYLHLLALNALGVSLVPLTSAASDDEILHIVSHSDSKLIVVIPEYVERFKAIAQNIDGCSVMTETELPGKAEGFQPAATDHRTEAALLYTSGTTGKPKGCILSNEYFIVLGAWYNGLGDLCSLDRNDRLLTSLPPNHMNSLCTSFMAMMLCGGCVIQLDRFHPRIWWQTVREEEATIIHCLGVMTAILLKLPEAEGENFASQVKFNFGPGSDPRHQGAFERRFGIPVIECWAMTESGAGGLTIAYKEPRHVGQRCIGKPTKTTECRIVDEKDRDVADGESGELLVRSTGENPRRGFFSGYYKDTAATDEGWRGGWWHTGDVVRKGDDGSLFFVDRRKNVIRRSGENIAAVEVEAILLASEAVQNCAVCAVPDEIRGDEVFAFVVSNTDPDPRGIFDHCMQHLTYFKAPGYLAMVDELPLTASQKVSRGEIKTLAREKLASGACVDLREFKKRSKA